MYKGTVGLFVLKADNYSSTEWTWHFTDWCFWRGWTRTECAWREEKKWQKMTKGGEWKDRLGFVFKVVLLKLKWHFGEMCTFQKPCGSARGIPSHATLISALTLYFDTKHTRQRRAALVAHTQCTLPKLIPNHFFITGMNACIFCPLCSMLFGLYAQPVSGFGSCVQPSQCQAMDYWKVMWLYFGQWDLWQDSVGILYLLNFDIHL